MAPEQQRLTVTSLSVETNAEALVTHLLAAQQQSSAEAAHYDHCQGARLLQECCAAYSKGKELLGSW